MSALTNKSAFPPQLLQVLPWSFKIFAGLLTDCVPVFGMRRKPYFLLGWLIYFAANMSLAVAGDPDLKHLIAGVRERPSIRHAQAMRYTSHGATQNACLSLASHHYAFLCSYGSLSLLCCLPFCGSASCQRWAMCWLTWRPIRSSSNGPASSPSPSRDTCRCVTSPISIDHRPGTCKL